MVQPPPSKRRKFVDSEPPVRLSRAPKLSSKVVFDCLVHDQETLTGARHYVIESSAYKRMLCHVQILTVPTADTPGTCLLLQFANKRYLFGNISEGMQRVTMEHKISLNKVSQVFVTGKTSWRSLGGILGMILTVADSVQSSAAATAELARLAAEKRNVKLQGNLSVKERQRLVELNEKAEKDKELDAHLPTMTIHGGANIMHTIASARRFIFRKGLPIYVHEYTEAVSDQDIVSEPSWSDDNIKVWAIPLRPDSKVVNESPTRKRSHDEYTQDLKTNSSVRNENSGNLMESIRTDVLRGIVSDMFNSDWKLDALVEKPLKDVQMPAAIFIRNPISRKLEKYQGVLPGQGEPVPSINVLVRRPWPGSLVTELPETKPSLHVMCYIVRNHTQRGKFLPAKAKALKVKPGPNFMKLSMGESVISEDGQTVTSDQVLEPSRPGNGFFVIDLPSAEYLPSLFLLPHWNSKELMEGVKVVFWILGSGITQDFSFQEFIQQHTQFEHIISSPDHNSNRLSMDSAATSAIRHFQIDPSHYSILKHDNLTKPLPENLPRAVLGDRGMKVQLEPSFNLDVDTVTKPLNTAAVVKKTSKDVLELAASVKTFLSSSECQVELDAQKLPNPDAEIITLGTGSALPSKYRNVSATLLRVPGIGSYLFDCGESTLGQLSRIYDKEQLTEVLKDLRMIWISHLHADHHLGTASLIKAWNDVMMNEAKNGIQGNTAQNNFFASKNAAIKNPLFVMSDRGMIEWLREYSGVEDIGHENIVSLCVCGTKKGDPKSTTMYRRDSNSRTYSFYDQDLQVRDGLRSGTGLEDFAAAYVSHCHGSMAVSLTFASGLKVSYSGDCRPSKDFVDIGKGSTVLIHEATFDDELAGDAKAKKHSTTSEAIGVGLAMNARRIVLTHFSQRYQKIPEMSGLGKIKLNFERTDNDDEEIPAGVEAVRSGATPEDNQMVDEPRDQDSKSASKDTEVQTIGAGSQLDTKIVVAFDYMRVKLKDIAIMEKFNPALMKLYEEKENTGDQDA